MNAAREKIKMQWNALPASEKNLLRFYLQFSEEDLLTRIENYSKLVNSTNDDSKVGEFLKQVELYKIAYLLKLHKIPVKGGKRSTRKQRGKKKTRRSR